MRSRPRWPKSYPACVAATRLQSNYRVLRGSSRASPRAQSSICASAIFHAFRQFAVESVGDWHSFSPTIIRLNRNTYRSVASLTIADPGSPCIEFVGFFGPTLTVSHGASARHRHQIDTLDTSGQVLGSSRCHGGLTSCYGTTWHHSGRQSRGVS